MNIVPATPATMSSREIAELTGKQHQHVRRDIEVMLKELQLEAFDFDRIYIDAAKRKQRAYHLTRELTETLLTGYSIPLRHKVILRWRELEEGQSVIATIGEDPRLSKIAFALRAGIIDQAEANRRAQLILDEFAPAPSKALPAPSKQKQDWRDIPVRVFRCARPNERRPTPMAYVPPILDVRLEDIPDRWLPFAALTSYLSNPAMAIGHALWASGLVEWDGWPTDEGLAAGVRLCGPEDDPDIEVDARRVARALKARPALRWCEREENYVPIYRR